MLYVIERSDVRIPRGNRTSPTWKCRCDCGAIVYRATDTLTGPGINACPDCAKRYTTQKMREGLSFVDGTQISKITDMTPSSANTSGVRGVSFDKNSKKWRAVIIFKQKKYHLGLFAHFDDAVAARKKAENDFFGTFLSENEDKIKKQS